jgi:hypothetical protein
VDATTDAGAVLPGEAISLGQAVGWLLRRRVPLKAQIEQSVEAMVAQRVLGKALAGDCLRAGQAESVEGSGPSRPTVPDPVLTWPKA